MEMTLVEETVEEEIDGAVVSAAGDFDDTLWHPAAVSGFVPPAAALARFAPRLPGSFASSRAPKVSGRVILYR